MVNIQPNFKIFGQHQGFEVIFIIWSRVDHDSSRKTLKSSKVKSYQIRVSLGEVKWTLTKHNFHMLHQLFPKQIPFWIKLNSIQLLFYSQVQKMHHWKDMSQYIIGHFKSQQKDTSYQGKLHQDKVSKCKNYKKIYCRGHL